MGERPHDLHLVVVERERLAQFGGEGLAKGLELGLVLLPRLRHEDVALQPLLSHLRSGTRRARWGAG